MDENITNDNFDIIKAILLVLAQTILGLTAMKHTENGSWVHCDLHIENILYKKIQKNNINIIF